MNNLRIVCAACKHPDGRVALGVRHFDQVMWRQILDVAAIDFDAPRSPRVDDWNRAEQGFVTNNGDFVTREQAWNIAVEQQKLIDPDWCRGSLHSEHLY